MAVKRHRPTSSGRRQRTDLVRQTTKKRPEKGLTWPLKGPVGRQRGRITVRHRSRGAKKHYRVIDFKRDKREVAATVAALEYDPNRGPRIALLYYQDGEKRYILAPVGLGVGDRVLAAAKAEIKPGNALPLKNIPLGVKIHNVELHPGRGGQLARGAGNSTVITAKEGKYVHLKLPSGEVKQVLAEGWATIGSLSNEDLKNIKLGKAGRKRHLGIRPTTRGVAFSSPRDHPHGGSYKTSGVGMHPKTPWGKPARGKLTRRRQKTEGTIIKSRRQKR